MNTHQPMLFIGISCWMMGLLLSPLNPVYAVFVLVVGGWISLLSINVGRN